MEKIRCLIVNDQPNTIKHLEGYVNSTPFLELRGKVSNSSEAMGKMSSEEIDLLLLDINIPDLTGIELTYPLNNDNHVIFTTTSGKYKLDEYKLDALDYLSKPFDYNEFLKATIKANLWFQQNYNKEESKNRKHYMLFACKIKK
ncbi:MAG: response regulator [Bacteroidota bacterium]|nr:response regulator [Bacteroidota bacterium]